MRVIMRLLRLALSFDAVYWPYCLLEGRYRRRQEALTARIAQLEAELVAEQARDG